MNQRRFRLSLAEMRGGKFSSHPENWLPTAEEVEEMTRSVLGNLVGLEEINLGVSLPGSAHVGERLVAAIVDAVLAGRVRKVLLDSGEISHLFMRDLIARVPDEGVPLTELSMYGFSTDGEELFRAVLAKCPELVKVTYTGGADPSTFLNALAESSIRHLDLTYISMNPCDAHSLASLIRRSATLTEVNATFSSAGNKGIRELFEAVEANPVLKKLRLPYIRFDSDAAQALVALLESDHCPIAQLWFDYNRIPALERARVIEALGRNTSLSDLNMFDIESGVSLEHSLSLLASLRHRGGQLKRLSFTPIEMTPELMCGLCDLIEVSDGLEFLNVNTMPRDNRCTRIDATRYWNALRESKSLEHVFLYLGDLDGDDVAEALELVLSNGKVHSFELRFNTLTRNAARSIHRVVARKRRQPLGEFTLDAEGAEEGAGRLVIAAIAVNTTQREVYIYTRLLLMADNRKMLRVAGLMNAVWRDGQFTDEVVHNRYLFFSLGNDEDSILMRACVSLRGGKDGSGADVFAKMGVARAEEGGALRLVIVSEDLEVLHDIALTRDVELVRDAETPAKVSLQSRGGEEIIRLDFSTANLAEMLLAFMDDPEADLDEGDRHRLRTFGEENADRFVGLVGTLVATQKLAVLVTGVMHDEGVQFALSDLFGTHLRAALMEEL